LQIYLSVKNGAVNLKLSNVNVDIKEEDFNLEAQEKGFTSFFLDKSINLFKSRVIESIKGSITNNVN
jgi:hypothetical protein